jgi:hypothetical protein
MFRFLKTTVQDLKDGKNLVGPALFGARCFLAVVLSYDTNGMNG